MENYVVHNELVEVASISDLVLLVDASKAVPGLQILTLSSSLSTKPQVVQGSIPVGLFQPDPVT